MPGQKLTFEHLAKTPNEAAVKTLLCALESSDRSIRDAALRALLHRNSLVAKEGVLQRWHLLAEHGREILHEGLDWLSPALRTGIRGYHAQLHENACAATIALHDYELIPSLVEALHDANHPFRERSAATLLTLAEMLHDVLHAPRDYRDRRDPQQLRAFIIPSLEHCVTRGDKEVAPEIMEAFLLLAGREHAALKHILITATDRHHRPMEAMLWHGTRPGLTRLLLSYLDDVSAPLAALQVMGRRTDVSFIRQLFRRIGSEPAKVIRSNLHRITKCSWLEQGLAILEALNESEQAGAAQFAVHSGIERSLALEVVAFLLRRGGVAARRSAATLLHEFPGAVADELTLLASNDKDPYVRAISAPQLRQRKIAGGIKRLLEMVESENTIERDAARGALDEFQYDHLLDVFDELSPEIRKQTGVIVKRVDPHALQRLSEELNSNDRRKKQRGLEMVIALDAVGELHSDVVALLKDEDEYLRAEAVRVLAQFDIPETRQALRSALLDSSRLVQETADRAIAELRTRSTHPFAPLNMPGSEPWSATTGTSFDASSAVQEEPQ